MKDNIMPLFVIDLQEGFSGENISVNIDGHDVFKGQNIATRNQIGLAKQIKKEIQSGNHTVRINLEDRGIDESFSIDSSATPFLGISVLNNEIVFTPEATAFGYV